MSERGSIDGRTVVVTGGTTGIGRATVEELARRGARVIFSRRSAAVGDSVVADVRRMTGNSSVEHRLLHLDDLSSVRSFAAGLRADLDRLDVLVNNAGVVLGERRVTADDLEMTMGVNHFGHFLLAAELRDLLVASAPARVVIVSSGAHRTVRHGLDFENLNNEQGRFGARRGLRVYAESKLANMLHMIELARRLASTGVSANAVHPGVVRTRLGRDSESWWPVDRFFWPVMGRFMRTPVEGAATSVWAASSPELDGVSGAYLADQALATPAAVARDAAAAARLWDISETLVGE